LFRFGFVKKVFTFGVNHFAANKNQHLILVGWNGANRAENEGKVNGTGTSARVLVFG
jgi:hypothetical protein